MQRTYAKSKPNPAAEARAAAQQKPVPAGVRTEPKAPTEPSWDFTATPAQSAQPRLPLIPRLKLGSPDDAFERDADRMASDAMRGTPAVPAAQARATRLDDPRSSHNAGLDAVYNVLRAPGEPLDRGTRALMEPRFGHNFADVRVHTDPAAAASARALNASAYAARNHLVFASGRYAPGSEPGNRLLAHELAHVVQERASAGSDTVMLHRQLPDPQDAAGDGPGPNDNPAITTFPGWGYWLASDEYFALPNVENARADVGHLHPELIRSLFEASVEETKSPSDPEARYLTFRDAAHGVLARARLSLSGENREQGRPRKTYGVYVFMRDSEGKAMYGIGGTQATAGGAQKPPQQAGPSGPPDPLLDLYFKQFPPTPGGSPTSAIDQSMKLRLALALADRSFFGSVYDAAMAAISDPMFIGMTVLMIGIYVGLWLTPDPTLLTKVAAGILTAAMLAMFGWNDLIGFGRAWMALQDASAGAKTEDELRAAGNAFMKKLGQVGFDVFLMILFWGAGKAFKGRLQSTRAGIAERATGRAEAGVTEAESQPGSGGKRPPATAEELGALKDARAAAGDKATPSQVLDKLADKLPDKARDGLASERGSGDAATDKRLLGILEARARAGQDVFRWLTERGLSGEEAQSSKQGLIDARARLARARLVQMKALEETPSGRRSATNDARNTLADFARALGRLSSKFRQDVKQAKVDTVTGDLGEALARGQLQQTLQPGQQVVGSLELAEPVEGFKTISEWAAKQRASGADPVKNGLGAMRQGPTGIFRSVGQIDNAVVRQTESGTLKFESIEETKTGKETAQSAGTQVRGARTTLENIYNGTGKARVMERLSSTTVGRDITSRYSVGGTINATTRGPAGRTGFDADLGVSQDDLEAVARQIISEGVPTGEPGVARQVQSSGPGKPDKDDKK